MIQLQNIVGRNHYSDKTRLCPFNISKMPTSKILVRCYSHVTYEHIQFQDSIVIILTSSIRVVLHAFKGKKYTNTYICKYIILSYVNCMKTAEKIS